MTERERRVIRKPPISAALLLLLLGLPGSTAHAQEARLPVLVEYIAGSNLYITDGIGAGDTLWVYEGTQGAYRGALSVISSSRESSVVTFADDPFPITRGDTLYIAVIAGERATLALAETPVPAAAAAAAASATQRFPTRPPVQVHGRLSFQLSLVETQTKWLSNRPEQVERSFVTPVLRFRTAVTNLPGDLRFNLSLRASERYSTHDIVQPQRSVRFYQASIGKRFKAVQVELGRFYVPTQILSDYFDGLFVRIGSKRVGGGFAAGFEPELADQQFSTTLPKYSVFFDYNYSGRPLSYFLDVSFNQVRPRNDWHDHTFVGLSQRLYWDGLQLTQSLQVDRDPVTDRWVVTMLQARISAPLAAGLFAQARYHYRQPYSLSAITDLVSPERDQGGVGVTYAARGGTLSAFATANRYDGYDNSYGGSASFDFPRTAFLGLGFSGSGSYWTRDDGHAVYVTPGLRRMFGGVQTRLLYNYYSTDTIRNAFITHSLDLSLTFPLARRFYATVRGRVQRGDNLEGNSLYMSLWKSF
jgi:hypothetical protein